MFSSYLTEVADVNILLVSTWNFNTIIKMLNIDKINLRSIIYNSISLIIENNIDNSYEFDKFIIDLINLQEIIIAKKFIEESQDKIIFVERGNETIMDDFRKDILEIYFSIRGKPPSTWIFDFSVPNYDYYNIIDNFWDLFHFLERDEGGIEELRGQDYLENLFLAALDSENITVLESLIEFYDYVFLDEEEDTQCRLFISYGEYYDKAKYVITNGK